MMEILETEPGVIAVKFSGRMRGDEIDEVTTLVERSLEAHERTHVYVEVHDNFSFDVGAMAACLPRGAAMLTRLDRFGRIAIVSEQRFVLRRGGADVQLHARTGRDPVAPFAEEELGLACFAHRIFLRTVVAVTALVSPGPAEAHP